MRTAYKAPCPVWKTAATPNLGEVDETDDVRNGLLLTANLHRAFDASLWALHPETLRVVTRHRGPSLDDLQISADRLRQDVPPPHRDALDWRYHRFVTAAKETSLDVAAG